MNTRPCIRCGQPLVLDEGHLVYCSACGAPQIFLSDELQDQIRSEAHSPAEAGSLPSENGSGGANTTLSGTAAARGAKPATEDRGWPLAVEYALLSGGIALGLNFGAMLFGPLLILAWLWVVSAPILTVGFYGARAARPTPAFAARLGLLTGFLVSLGCAVVLTISLLLTRFVFHGAAAFDAGFATAVAQAGSNASARYGAYAEPTLKLLGIPEFRVGFLLWMAGIVTAGYLLMSAAAAGVAGLLLGRRRAA